MPQIAQLSETIAGQVFWALIFFGFIFFVIGRGMVPKVMATVESRDKLVMPVTLRVTFSDGSKRDVRLPAESWIRSASSNVPVVSDSPVVRAELDPDHKLPDKDRSNNLAAAR